MLSPHKTTVITFKVVQINLDKSKLATSEIVHYCEKEDVDIVCMQEPYTYSLKLLGMPTYAVTILPEDPTPMVAVVIFKKDIETLVHLKYEDRWTLCVEISRGNHKVIIVNIYCQFSLPRDIFVRRLEGILTGFVNKYTNFGVLKRKISALALPRYR